jgi:hypothetical protein
MNRVLTSLAMLVQALERSVETARLKRKESDRRLKQALAE